MIIFIDAVYSQMSPGDDPAGIQHPKAGQLKKTSYLDEKKNNFCCVANPANKTLQQIWMSKM